MTAHNDFSLEEMLDYLKDRCQDVNLVAAGSQWSLVMLNASEEETVFVGSLRHVVAQAFQPFYSDALSARRKSIQQWNEMEEAVNNAFIL
jgi:hypothetical protein